MEIPAPRWKNQCERANLAAMFSFELYFSVKINLFLIIDSWIAIRIQDFQGILIITLEFAAEIESWSNSSYSPRANSWFRTIIECRPCVCITVSRLCLQSVCCQTDVFLICQGVNFQVISFSQTQSAAKTGTVSLFL